jgi:molecular chaperone GrpE
MTENVSNNTEEQTNDPGEPDEVQTSELEQLAQELDAARNEAAQWRDKYVRLLAEFDNFRKRVRQDMELQRTFTTEILLAELLPTMDDLERMLATDADANDPYRRGAELIRDKLKAYLQSHNVERMECKGKLFNPEEHDALMMRPTMDFPPGTVLDEITPGYRLGERVIRHAQVVVSELAETEPPTNPVLP